MLGRHVGERPTDGGGGGLGVVDPGLLREVEVQQHRQTVAGHQDVRRLDVAVQDLAVVGVLERLGHPGAPPGDRLGISPSGERLPARGTLHQGTALGLKAIQQVEKVGTGAGGPDLRMIQDLEQRDPAEIRHAEQMQAGCRVGPVRVDGDDVGVLEPRQRLRLARAGSRHLQRDGPVGEMLLLRKVDPREGAPPQLLDQPEPRDRSGRPPGTACQSRQGPREAVCSGPADQVVNLEDFLGTSLAMSGNRALYSAASGDSPASSRRQYSS